VVEHGRQHERALVPRLLELSASEDAREGVLSFIERREARFVGR